MHRNYQFGKALRELLAIEKMKQIDLVKKSGLSKSSVSELISGINNNPGIETLQKIADACKVDLIQIIILARIDKKRKRVNDEIESYIDRLKALLYPNDND
jgi:transcriptional regulator with XRE-family HTH domain